MYDFYPCYVLQGAIQLTEEILKGEEKTVEFQVADTSGKIGAAAVGAGTIIAGGRGAGLGLCCVM